MEHGRRLSARTSWATRSTDTTARLVPMFWFDSLACALRTEFLSVGLNLSAFDLDDPSKTVFQPTNELLYDLLTYLVEADSAAEMFMLGTGAVSHRD
ncbi:hypothetical protein CYMTET_5750 [Cymbomonas tetramitiformis]|uniref:Uncharacterized protein n=1 Tax=Cymbomonas tetramitiformis TaxID=36881 RepID=A0AAE0GYS6_9CHLO|nr:hypothetical protein CYMTET_5750 [Cymbomonas tetramitiformis]